MTESSSQRLDATLRALRARFSQAVPVLSLTAQVWLVLGALQLAVYLSLPGTAWHTEGLEVGERFAVLCLELLALTLPALLIGVTIGLLGAPEGCEAGKRAAYRPLLRGVQVLLVWSLCLLYAASWMSFRGVGRFLDLGALRFWLANPVQILQHVGHLEPYTLVLVPIATLAAALGLCFFLPRVKRRVDRRASRGIVAVSGLLLGAFLLVAWGGAMDRAYALDPVVDPAVGMIYTRGDLYAAARDGRTGPVTHFIADLRHLFWDRTEPALASDEIPLIQRPIIPLDDYLAAADTENVSRWNVIVIIVESLRDDQLLLYGGTREVMPAVEELCRGARVFTNNYTQSSHSNYSDLAPLSSHYPLRSRRYHIYPEHPTYPRVLIYDVLKALGYRVAVFSSQNENWGGMINYLRTGSIDTLLHAENFEGPTYVPRQDIGFADFVKGSKRSGKIDDRFTVGAASDWLDSIGDDPFFIYMNLQNSHIPYETPADFVPRFGPGRASFPLRFGYFPPDSLDAVMDLYSNSLAYVDFQLERFFRYLSERGLSDRTVIILTGDTGQAFWEHGFTAHANMLFNEVMKVPLIVKAPGLEPGVDDRLTQHIDVPPTVLALMGLPPHPSFQGRNLLDHDLPEDRSVYLVAQAPLAHQYSIVRQGFKLIYDARRNEYALYDLERDPGETVNLGSRLPAVAGELAVWLDTWRKVQIDYYESPHLHERWYPPVLAE
ncbi:MAG: sulfatase [Gemmatimonadota bacterium]|nr:MAG: sulfatase [Gemmatimonadota bacterium]